MKVNYKGFELEAKREASLGGPVLLYYSVFSKDGYEYVCSFEDSAEKIRDKIKHLKEWVDNFLTDINNGICPYCGSMLFANIDNRNKLYCASCDEFFNITS